MTTFFEIYNNFFTIPKKKNNSTIKGACDIVLSGTKLPYKNYENAWGIAVHCEINKLMCFDFDVKNISEEGEEFVRNTFDMFCAWFKNRFKEDDYYIEKSKSGGYHVIFKLNEGVSSEIKTNKNFLKYKEKGVVELLCAGKQAWVTVAPTEGYETLHGDLCKTMPLTYLMALEVIDFFRQFRPKQEYKKGTCEYIADYLCDTLGIETVMQALGYTYIGKRSGCASWQVWDKNPTAKTPSAGFQNDNYFFYDHKEKVGFHAGELYFQLTYNGDVQLFSQDYPDFYSKKNKKDDIENEENNNRGGFQPMYAYFCGDEKFIRFEHEGKEYDFSARNFKSNGTLAEWLFVNGFHIKTDADVIAYKKQLFPLGGADIPIKDTYKYSEWINDKYVLPTDERYIKLECRRFNQKGTYDEWLKTVWNPVKSDKYVQICALTAIAGLYAGVSFYENFGINLSAKTASGKTTLIEIVASVFGKPNNEIHGWDATKAVVGEWGKSYRNSCLMLNDMTIATHESLTSILNLLVANSREKIEGRGGKLEVSKNQRLSLTVLSTSEQPYKSYFKKKRIQTTGGLRNRLIDVPMMLIGRIEDRHFLKSAKKARNNLYGTAILKIIEEIKPDDLENAFNLELEDRQHEINKITPENRRIAQTYCILHSLGKLLNKRNVLDLPNVTENVHEIMLHSLGIQTITDIQTTSVEQEILDLLDKVKISGKHSVRNVRNLEQDRYMPPNIPDELCVIHDFEFSNSETCNSYVLMGQFEKLVEKYTTATRDDIYYTFRKFNIAPEQLKKQFRVLGKQKNVRKLN